MLSKVLETIKKNNMLKAGDRVVCALSGGADSMALLCVLYELKDELGIEVYAANLNHSIRGEEGDGDSEFVKDFCQKKGIELFYKKVDIPHIAKNEGMSEEECGRRERYRFFEHVAEKIGGGKIATGHHSRDSAETVLFNLFRGSGAGGLRGIAPVRDNIIRPLIDTKKDDIEKYLNERNIPWREDSTNLECIYARNRIRLVIMKEIEKLFPACTDKITSAAEAIATDDEYLNFLAKESGAFDNGVIYKEKFVPLHESLRRRVIIHALKYWQAELSGENISAVYETILGPTGKGRDLGGKVRVENNYSLVSKCEKKTASEDESEYTAEIGKDLEISAFGGIWSIKTVDKTPKMRDNKMMLLLDADKMGGKVTIRRRRDGDYMYPTGMDGKKKIKKIFIDLKIPKKSRDTISVAAVGDEVLFIPGVRKSRSYAPDGETKRFCVIEYTDNRNGYTKI